MAVTAVLFWVSIVIAVTGCNAAGELAILHSPDSLGFTGSSTVLESTLKEMSSAALGLSVEQSSEWNGLVVKDPFKSPEAVVMIYVDGIPTLSDITHFKGPNYQLQVDEYEPDTFEAMKHRIQQRFSSHVNNLVSIKLSDNDEIMSYDNVFGDVVIPKLHKQAYQHLNPENEESLKFLQELSSLKAITDKVKAGAITADNAIDFYFFRYRTLHALSDFYGPNSLETKEAKKVLGEELERLANAFVKSYDGSVLVTVVTTDVAHTRRPVRSLADNPSRRAAKDTYAEDYAAIFNILLWFGVVFVFTLIAIVYALMDMDPGRDSIIYRMTSTRMKKDN